MTSNEPRPGGDATDLENAPIMKRTTTQYYSFMEGQKPTDKNANTSDEGSYLISDVNPMKYDQGSLLSWRVIFKFRGSAMDNPDMWKLLLKMFALSLIIAVGTCCIDRWRHLDTSKFQRLSSFLNVFVGLMLGFFLSLQMNRWFACAGGFMELFDAVRNLQIQCFALGVNKERTSNVVRYGVLSAWLLYFDLVVKSQYSEDDAAEQYDKVWKDIEWKRPGLVTQSEKEMLAAAAEPAGCIWTWVSSLIGRMAQDGDIPDMPTPTYGRIMNLAQSAHGAIRNVRMNVLVQAPYVYAHMLALLVHFNNILNTINFGMTMGVIFSNRSEGNVFEASQDTAVAFFLSLLAPFLYQAILEVSLAVARPFSHEDGLIPVPVLIEGLERDLSDCAKLADSPPTWEKPLFKRKPAS